MRDWTAIVERMEGEDVLKVTQAAKLVHADRGRRGYCSAAALVAWILRGKRGIFLDGYRGSGKTWWTSREALRRFKAQLTAAEARRRGADVVMASELLPPAGGELERRAERAREEIRKLRGTG